MPEFQSYLLGRRCCIWIKVKVTPWHVLAGTGGRQRYSSKPITTSPLWGWGWGVGVAWSAPSSSRCTPGKYPVPIVPEACWASGPVCKGSANLSPVGFDPQSVRLVANCYAGYTVLATIAYEYSTSFISAELHLEGEMTHRTAPCIIADVFSTYMKFLYVSLFPGVFLSIISSMEILSLASISDSLLSEILLDYCSLWNLL